MKTNKNNGFGKIIITVLLAGALGAIAFGIFIMGSRMASSAERGSSGNGFLSGDAALSGEGSLGTLSGSTDSGSTISGTSGSADSGSALSDSKDSGNALAGSGLSGASGASASGSASASSDAASSTESVEPDVPYKEQGEAVWATKMPADGTEIVPIDHAAYTYEEMRRDLYLLTVRYPDKVKTDSLGETADGRQIMEAVIGNESASNHIIIQYAMHAREYLNSLLAMKSLELYLMNYDTGTYDGETYAQLFSDVCIHIIPMSNPDGVTVAQSGTVNIARASLRKNLEDTYASDTNLKRTTATEAVYFTTFKANANGVDLNKNFPVGWDTYLTGVPWSSTDCYKGVSAGSEAETQAIIGLIDRVHVSALISYHSAGQTVYWNYGSVGDVFNADKTLATLCTKLTNYAMTPDYTNSAKAHGGCSDYCVLVRGFPAVTIETGTGNCPLDIGQFQKILAQNINVIPAAAKNYGG